MHVPAATVKAEVGEAKAQWLSNVVLLAATTAICCIFVWKMVPETKSRTLEQIQETFST
jgi:hypothetical protein